MKCVPSPAQVTTKEFFHVLDCYPLPAGGHGTAVEAVLPDAALEAANAKAEMLEAKLLCYESGVSGGYADDVIALAKSYGGDVKSAIGEVIAKYPFFCSAGAPKPAEKEKLTTGVRFSSEQKSSMNG